MVFGLKKRFQYIEAYIEEPYIEIRAISMASRLYPIKYKFQNSRNDFEKNLYKFI